jgi:hypothetical protein
LEQAKIRLRMSFVPDWNHIESIRCSIGSLANSVIGEADRIAAVTMVTAELLENSFKHGNRADLVDYELDVRGEEVAITVANSWEKESESKVEAIETAINWIGTFESPLDAYIERMRTIYESEDLETSGLGLVRIVYEGQCTLQRDVDRTTQRVRVRASFIAREETA